MKTFIQNSKPLNIRLMINIKNYLSQLKNKINSKNKLIKFNKKNKKIILHHYNRYNKHHRHSNFKIINNLHKKAKQ